MGGWYWITLMVESGSAWHGQAQSELALIPAGMQGPGMPQLHTPGVFCAIR